MRKILSLCEYIFSAQRHLDNDWQWHGKKYSMRDVLSPRGFLPLLLRQAAEYAGFADSSHYFVLVDDPDALTKTRAELREGLHDIMLYYYVLYALRIAAG